MAIIQDVENEAGFQVLVRWFARASQRYPAAENTYYSTFFNTLNPNEGFILQDDAFNINNINDVAADLEYVIFDVCHVQTLLPQSVGTRYFNPDYIEKATLTSDANIGDTTLSVDDISGLGVNANIQIGPIQSDFYNISSLSGTTVTLNVPLTKNFLAGEDVSDANAIANYPDMIGANVVARILDNNGSLRTDSIQVTHPIYYDEAETVRRYYYDSFFAEPFNGARGSGSTTNQTTTINDVVYEAAWWAFGDEDNSAATEGVLIDSQGFVVVIDGREQVLGRDHAFELYLSIGEGARTSCTNPETSLYFGNHPNYSSSDITMATTSIRTAEGGLPGAGYYTWTSTVPANVNQRYVRYWNGTAFESGRVATGFVDNCPRTVTDFISVEIFGTLQDLVCNNGGVSRTLWFYSNNDTFTPGNLTAVYTNEYGPDSDFPSALGASYIKANDKNYVWNGTTLTEDSGTPCDMGRYCGDPLALNGVSRDGIRDDSLCVYRSRFCNEPTASNYLMIGDVTYNNVTELYQADQTAQDTFSVCNFNAPRFATYAIELNITGPREGRTMLVNPDNGFEGETWNISYSITLTDGYEWITEPTNLTGSNTGVWGDDVTLPVTITGEVRKLEVTPVGCNRPTADNYTADSDGTATCFFGPFTYSISADDLGVCSGFEPDVIRQVTFYSTATDPPEAVGSSFYELTGGDYVVSNETGWLSGSGVNKIRIVRGIVTVGSTACPTVPSLFGKPRITRIPRSVFRGNEEFTATALWSVVGTFPDGLEYQWSGDALVGDTERKDSFGLGTNEGTRVDLFTLNTAGQQRVTITVYDKSTGLSVGKDSASVTVKNRPSDFGESFGPGEGPAAQ